MIITLSPSKGQDFSSPTTETKFTQAQQLKDSQHLIDAISACKVSDIQALMNVSENIARLTVERIAQFSLPFTPENARQALFAFTGDVYRPIEVEQYSAAQLKFAQNHLRILSGLYGYLRPLDLIQPYRLEMKTKLSNKRGINLYEFWGERITDLLNKELAQHDDKVLVNLASNEYFKSIKPKLIKGKLLHINFKETKDGKTRTIAIFAKRARGLMANWIIKNQLQQSQALKDFGEAGYQFNESISDDKQLTFVRPQP